MDGLKAVPFKEFGFFRKLFSRALLQSQAGLVRMFFITLVGRKARGNTGGICCSADPSWKGFLSGLTA
jgi:hypothetical protein